MDHRALAPRPASAYAWLAFAWSVGGTALVLIEAVVRLLPRALALGEVDEPLPLAVASGWSAFMVYVEGWRGFHQRFNPRVVARAALLASRPWWSAALGPLVVMGLVDATPRRAAASWALVLAVTLMIVGLRYVPEPWRAAIDVGVVLGLSVGTVSLGTHAVRAARGRAPAVAPDYPSPG